MNGDIAEYTCTVCWLPSVRASVGGPGICPSCDCGHYRNGQKWDISDAHLASGDPQQQVAFRARAKVAALKASSEVVNTKVKVWLAVWSHRLPEEAVSQLMGLLNDWDTITRRVPVFDGWYNPEKANTP